MPETPQQSYANHARLDPSFHFVLLPLLAINLIVSIVNVIRFPSWGSGWFVVLSVTGALAVLKMRQYAAQVQDRIIRLEERLRLASVLAEPWRSRIEELTPRQLVALRFAADAELPGLVEKTLSNKLPPAEIKKAIVVWRADFFRV